MRVRMDGSTPVVTVKAPSAIHAEMRVFRASWGGKVPAYYAIKVIEVAPANEAGNATYECRLLIGR